MNLTEIKKPYAISLIGFNSENVVKPFLSQTSKVRSIVLLHSDHPRALAAKSRVINILRDNVGIYAYSILLNDIFNFYEILMVSESIRATLGDPVWINTTAGPGLGASALTLMASNYDIDIISFDRETDETRVVPMARIKDIYECRDRYISYLRAIDSENRTSLSNLASVLDLSLSTVSRHIKIFKQLDLVHISGSGRGNSPYIISLSGWGKRFLGASEIYLMNIKK